MDILNKLINQKIVDSYISIGSWLWITLEDKTVIEISSPWVYKKTEQTVLDSESENIEEINKYLIEKEIVSSFTEMKHGSFCFYLTFNDASTLEATVGFDDEVCIHNIAKKEISILTPNGITVEAIK